MDKLIYNISTRMYETTQDIVYKNYEVKKGFEFDGASIPWFVTGLFSENDRKKGLIASCFHDHACKYNAFGGDYKQATDMLVDLWVQAGLGDRWYTSWKPHAVRFGVNFYQRFWGSNAFVTKNS